MKRKILLGICGILAFLLLLSLPFFLFVLSLRGLSENTVVKTLDSPSGTYFAQVTDSDHGAMGGATIVKVYKSQAFLGWHKKVARVYSGKYGEHLDMEIYWKDDHCLVINGKEYPIK